MSESVSHASFRSVIRKEWLPRPPAGTIGTMNTGEIRESSRQRREWRDPDPGLPGVIARVLGMAVLLLTWGAGIGEAGSLSGTVMVATEAAPKPASDLRPYGDGSSSSTANPVRDVVIYLQGVPPEARPERRIRAVMGQKDKAFTPT